MHSYSFNLHPDSYVPSDTVNLSNLRDVTYMKSITLNWSLENHKKFPREIQYNILYFYFAFKPLIIKDIIFEIFKKISLQAVVNQTYNFKDELIKEDIWCYLEECYDKATDT